MRPLILLSNDDGVDSPGLIAMRIALGEFADVITCAPATNQSASSHSLTLSTVLRLSQRDDKIFALDGTPADCIYVALHSKERIVPRLPDVVVSGMNNGPNLGADVVYSGTVAAAREGAQRGIMAVAVSAHHRANREAAATLAARFVAALWNSGARETSEVGHAPLFNINVPAGDAWPLAATRLGKRAYADDVIYRADPRRREYLWIGGSDVEHDPTEGTDTAAWDQGIASVTPLALDLFDPRGTPLTQRIVDLTKS